MDKKSDSIGFSKSYPEQNEGYHESPSSIRNVINYRKKSKWGSEKKEGDGRPIFSSTVTGQRHLTGIPGTFTRLSKNL